MWKPVAVENNGYCGKQWLLWKSGIAVQCCGRCGKPTIPYHTTVMSVVLTAFRNSKTAKAKKEQLKKKKTKDRKKSSSLLIEGDQYIPEQRSWVRLWTVNLDNIFYYIKYHYGTGSVNCNGDFLKTISGFSKEGPQTIFLIGSHEACIQTVTNGVNKYGCFHTLKVNGEIVPE
ncbi:fas apoptotic inhibitory molecule 1-like isoform X48 [Octopus vulgaris]|uniref:Fas apoptotic inhibitory molecule 1-like isoform X48 n=2 Tax=Octopus vulgaris TaxID=6645 RepID=A0AA36BNS6_OCTVU|nr:fas apoptotic inhibitory molecule 1-like isoform X48 [Octopus vulgaris]